MPRQVLLVPDVAGNANGGDVATETGRVRINAPRA